MVSFLLINPILPLVYKNSTGFYLILTFDFKILVHNARRETER